jgi:serine/threonine protein kinase/Tfp pilus assembly protein PilF
VATTQGRQACSVCGTLLANDSVHCPVCALHGAVEPQSDSGSDISSELRFEHYTVLKNAEGKPLELGRGGMGITYKAFDVHLQCPVALKIINAQLFGNDSARLRFIREARAAASVRHPNVASVFHIGEAGGNYYYAMEFVDGETLAALIRRSTSLEIDLALQIIEQVASGLTAIDKQHLVHRDIKPSNIIVSSQNGKLETVKIIDLGLAKGVAEEDSLSTLGAFIGTPAYASPEQFAGIATDIRSDLYSLGVTLWEMLTGKLPFGGSAAELMYQHQHADPPTERLKGIPGPVTALLRVLLARDPNQRFQSPTQLQQALTKVKEANGSELRLTTAELMSIDDQRAKRVSKGKPSKQLVRWVLTTVMCLVGVLIGWLFLSRNLGLFNQPLAEPVPAQKSIAVLPFENISANKDDAYFADGVQDEILNNLAKVGQLKVICRTSVMQYRADAKRDLREVANALGVANVLEGTVRRDGKHVRVSTELVDTRNYNTIWADSYDRDLTDIFTIQSDIAQKVASRLSAQLSPEERKDIEEKPTQNLEAYDLYLHANELILSAGANGIIGNLEKPFREAIVLLEQAVQLDPNFTLAYCAAVDAHSNLYHFGDRTPERRELADAAMNNALRLQPDLPGVRVTYAFYLYRCYRDYERAGVQLAIARRSLPNSSRAFTLAAYMNRRQGHFDEAIQELNQAIARDPRNIEPISELGNTLFWTRQFDAALRTYDRLIELVPDQPEVRVQRAYIAAMKNGDDSALRSALVAAPTSMSGDTGVLSWRLRSALNHRDWEQVKELIEKMKGGEDDGMFGYEMTVLPIGCYSILLARLQGEKPGMNPALAETREQLSQKCQKSPANALLLGDLSLVDALSNNKETAISEAKRAVEMIPIAEDAVDGPGMLIQLAIVYAWTNEPDLAFEVLSPLTKTPAGLFYGDLKLNSFWTPLRNDPRFEKLLAELAPRD